MSESEYSAFLTRYQMNTMKSIYDQVVLEDWKISDHYEALAAQGKPVPEDPINSQAYQDALDQRVIRIIQDEEGAYYDYNLYEVNMSPLLSAQGLVQIGEKIYQFGAESKKIIENGDVKLVNRLDQIETTQELVTVVHYYNTSDQNARQFGRHEWLYANRSGNGWYENDRKRYRFYLQGSSYVDDTYGQRLYVTNVLRIE